MKFSLRRMVKVMNKEKVFRDLKEELHLKRVLKDEPMNVHTSMKVGGPADIFVIPETVDEIKKLVRYVKENKIPFFVIGNGSNIIVKDKGIRGIVIQILDNFSKVFREDDILIAEAGVLLSRLSKFALNESLSGLEFACGIPGTLGGAIVMNAGAYDGQVSDVVIETEYLDSDGEIKVLEKNQHEFGYRTSFFSKNNYIILRSKLILTKSDREQIRIKMELLTQKRIEKQPLTIPSAGSIFKRPKGYYAGKLIQDAGLKGFSIGGAQVSEKHSGFIINKGGATAKDVIDLVEYIRDKVKAKFGIELEPEVKIIGED